MSLALQNTAAELRGTFLGAAGTPVDATGTPTVTITRDDGTAVVTAAATTKPAATTGVYAYTLTAAQTATLDILTAVWTGVVAGASQSFTTVTEVVGAFACSLADIDNELNRGGDSTGYNTDLKHAAREAATDAFEAECGRSFVPRYRRETLPGSGCSTLLLDRAPVLALRSASVSGTAVDTATVEVDTDGGTLWRQTGWSPGTTTLRNVTVVYTHGAWSVPGDVRRAVATLAASILKDGPFDERGYGVAETGAAIRLLTAGVSGASFSIPEVESALRRHRVPRFR